MDVSAAVMAHPSRLDAARRLCEALAPIDARVALDPEPDAKPGAMRSARRAWAAAGPHAGHHMVVQDDVNLAPGFAAAVASGVAVHPDAALSFFAEWGSRTAALVRLAALSGGASWVPMINPYVPTQALVLPSPLAADLAAFLRDTDDDEPDDEAVLRFLEDRGTRMLVSVPNLVEHLDRPSLAGNTGHGVRRAACFLPAAALGPTVLDPPALMPFCAWVDATATTVDTSTFARRPTLDVLAERGYDPARILAARGPGPAGIDDGHVTELWVAAVATGMLVPAGSDVDTPLARAAVRTMGPGALRTHVDFAVLDRHADALAALVTAGLRFGSALIANR